MPTIRDLFPLVLLVLFALAAATLTWRRPALAGVTIDVPIVAEIAPADPLLNYTGLLCFKWIHCAGPCARAKAVWEKLAGEGYRVRIVEWTEEQGLAKRFGVVQFPTTIVMVGGQRMARFGGYASAEEIRVRVRELTPTMASPAETLPRWADLLSDTQPNEVRR